MPGPQVVQYEVAACATSPVTFTPGTLPHPVVDSTGIVNGQYFLLTAQANPNQNGVWYADPTGPVAVMTVGGTGQQTLNPQANVQVGPNLGSAQNFNTLWSVVPNVRGNVGQPGFQLI